MVKVDDPRLPSELPIEVMSHLDPKLAELYFRLPSALASRISILMRQALPQGVRADRVLKFAFLYANAERFARGDSVSKDHTRRSKLELAGAIHGLQTGYRDDVEAKQRYRRGRQARQHTKASLESVLRPWRRFKQVVRKHRSELPEHVQPPFSDAILGGVAKALQNMGIAITCDEDDLATQPGNERERSEIAQAYIWWRSKIPQYRGKWNDMHRLAFAWKMSPTGSVKGFRTVVNRICEGATSDHRFEKSWESVLSENVSHPRTHPPTRPQSV
jgi:hypothetical protein